MIECGWEIGGVGGVDEGVPGGEGWGLRVDRGVS